MEQEVKNVIPEKLKIKEDISKLQEEVLQSLRNNAEINAKLQLLKLSVKDVKSNLGMLLTYYEDAVVCQKCPGMKACPKEHPCFSFDLVKEDGFLKVTRSPCRLANRKMMSELSYLIYDGDEEWLENTLEDVKKSKIRNPIIAQMINTIAGDSREWIYLRGNFNSGRSFISVCFANSFAKNRSNPVAFCDTAKLVDQLKELSIKNKEAFNKRIDSLSSCSLLILDGFGNEYKSDFNFSQVIYPLLSERCRKGLMTSFTSDFSIEEIIDMYSSKVGMPRARQLKNILDIAISKEYVLDGIKLY